MNQDAVHWALQRMLRPVKYPWRQWITAPPAQQRKGAKGGCTAMNLPFCLRFTSLLVMSVYIVDYVQGPG